MPEISAPSRWAGGNLTLSRLSDRLVECSAEILSATDCKQPWVQLRYLSEDRTIPVQYP